VRELRLQLRALQVVSGLGSGEDAGSEASGGGGDGGGASSRGAGGGGLEAMLVDKARRCEHEATVARLAAAQAQGAERLLSCSGLPASCDPMMQSLQGLHPVTDRIAHFHHDSAGMLTSAATAEEAQAAGARAAELEAEVARLQGLAAQLEEDLAAAAGGGGAAVRPAAGAVRAAAGHVLAAAAGDRGSGGSLAFGDVSLARSCCKHHLRTLCTGSHEASQAASAVRTQHHCNCAHRKAAGQPPTRNATPLHETTCERT
jgi:hypothetical protein